MITYKEILDNDIDKALDIYCESFNKDKVKSSIPLLGKLIGIYDDNYLIGFCQIDYINDIFKDQKRAYINNLCIKKGYQGMGYGDKLLNRCIDILKNDGISVIELTSNKNRIAAHKLYKKNGFVIVDTCVFKRNLL